MNELQRPSVWEAQGDRGPEGCCVDSGNEESAILQEAHLMEQLCSRGPHAYTENSERLWARNSMNCHFVGHGSFPFSQAKQLFRQHSAGYWMFLHRHVISKLLKRNCTHKLEGPWQSKAVQFIRGSFLHYGWRHLRKNPQTPQKPPSYLEAEEKEEKRGFPVGTHKLPLEKGPTSITHSHSSWAQISSHHSSY